MPVRKPGLLGSLIEIDRDILHPFNLQKMAYFGLGYHNALTTSHRLASGALFEFREPSLLGEKPLIGSVKACKCVTEFGDRGLVKERIRLLIMRDQREKSELARVADANRIGFLTEGEGFIEKKTTIAKHLSKFHLLFFGRIEPELVDDKSFLLLGGHFGNDTRYFSS